MSLRTRLLLLSLLTLGLPWAGCQYAREMERALRVGQEGALLTTARSLSQVVASEPELLYLDTAMRTTFDAKRRDFFAPRLPTRPLLDGYDEEWPLARADRAADTVAPVRFGGIGRTLYALASFELPAAHRSASTRVVLLSRDVDDNETAWSFDVATEGPVLAHATRIGAPWTASAAPDARVSGYCRLTPALIALELRMPMSLAGEQLALFVVDEHGRRVAGNDRLGWLHRASEPLRARLESFTSAGLRLSIVDVHGLLIARAGSFAPDPKAHLREVRRTRRLRETFYRQFLERPEVPAPPYELPVAIVGDPVDSALDGRESAVWIAAAYGDPSMIRAAVPLRDGSGIIGALVAEQPADRVLLLRDAALARLLDLTLLIGIATVVAVVLFSAWLAYRLRRLARAATNALSPEGKLEPALPEIEARDELGALARSFDALLERLHEYTTYLRSLGSKLSHELRTPLTVVSSSLENLDVQRIEPSDRVYLERARDGIQRLQRILGALSEATRVEQSIEQTERTEFDLVAVVREVGAAYQSSFGRDRIEIDVPDAPWRLTGSADLIAQLLDKLIENALDFCPRDGRIRLGVAAGPGGRLFVENDGPSLPPALAGRLFDSLTAERPEQGAGQLHLGLGLYIARLIAEFHGASIAARNRARGGVLVEIRWPGR
jgi:dedicated sortase system histidine kinase